MNFGSGAGGGNVAGDGELQTVETEQLAFQAASGEDKLRLLPSPWPADSLPPPTSSLLSIAPTKGLLAAAGPESLVIASTESVRHTLVSATADEDKIKPFTPQATLSIPRVSQVAFSSDESCLVITAEQGGGLAVYDTNTLVNGGKEAAFQLGTEGQSVRQLLPNPNPSQDLSRYFGVVTENGQLLLADLKDQKLVVGSNGSPVFHEKVTCACWSRLGKQLVAGLADGTAVQIDQQGVVKAEIPEPSQLAQLKDPSAVAYPITSIFWLETNDFLVIHTPINQSASGGIDDSIYHLAHREKASGSWSFSKFEDPCPAFGMERKPAQHFIQRLREWLDLSDVLVLSSTASADIGVFTRSKTPLDPQHPVIDSFTYTQPPDSRRAAMPVSTDGDTSPIGMAIDLSVKEKIPRPIPTEETLDESPVPLPALCVLNNEGVLSIWYIVYNASIRQSKPYPDLVAAGGPRALGEQKQQQSASQTVAPSPFGASSNAMSPFGQGSKPAASTFGAPSQPTSAFGQSSASSFGQSSTPAFGQASTPAFGGTSALGNRQSAWGSSASAAGSGSSAFKQPAFGSSTFGQAGGMNKASVWGTPQQNQQQQTSQQTPSNSSVFGGNASQASPFMNIGNQGSASGFANFAKADTVSASSGSVFGGLRKENQPQPSPFASAASKPTLSTEPSGSTVSFGTGTSFGSGGTTFGVTSFQSSQTPTPQQAQSREESMDDDEDEKSETSTLKPVSQQPMATNTNAGLSGLGSGFKLGSTFKPDGSAKDDLPKPKDPGAGLFGKGFGDALALGEGSSGGAKATKDDSRSGSEAAWMSGRSTPVVKKEPGTEHTPKLQDIPAAAPHQVERTAPVDDAPLPPDPTAWKPKPGALPPPIPPGFGSEFVKTTAKEEKAEEPVTSSRSTALENQATGKGNEQPLAGSPPVDLGGGKFSEDEPSVPDSDEAAGPPESDDEGDWSDEEEGDEADADAEADDDDDDEEGDIDEDEENRTPRVADPKGLSAFEARLTPASPQRAEQDPKSAKEGSTTPGTDKKDSYTPAGLPKAPIMFPPPQRSQESPRSPSPQRSATSPVRSMTGIFGSSQPALPANPVSLGKPGAQQPLTKQPQSRTSSILKSSVSQSRSTPQHPQRIAVPASQLTKPEKPTPPPKPVEPEEGELEDEEDARIQAILAAPIEPVSDVPAFLAHQDYVAHGREKEGLGGQIERVFRDINSMVDTLALNVRSLRGFVMGNSEIQKQGDKSRLDLEEEESWALGETGDLEGIMDGIDIELEDGRVEDVRGAVESLMGEEKEINRLRTKTVEVRQQIAARSDPNQLAQQRAAPLPMESQTQQSELRQGVQRVQKLLGQAEEQLSLLRAELASLPKSAGAEGGSAMPTVQAVTNTILKMTAMIEKKSGDIDVLESQIKKLGGPAALGLKPDYEDDLVAGLKASRLSQSSPNAFRTSRASMYGSPTTSKMRASRNTPGSFGKKSLFDVSDADVEAYRLKKEARRKVMETLREQLEVRGPRVVKVGQ